MDNDFKFLIDAGLDDDAKQHVQADIDKKLKGLKATIEQLNLDPKAAQALQNALLQNGINLNITVGQQQIQQAQKAGQQIGQQISKGVQNVIQKNSNLLISQFGFDGKKNNRQNDAAQRAKRDYEQLNMGLVTVHENMKKIGDSSELDSFIINVKKADGSIESLTYALEELEDKTGKVFKYIGGSINDNGVIKQFSAITNTLSQYKQKFEQFKSTNRDILSGLSQPIQKFEQELLNLENGVGSINKVKNAYRELAAEASKITGQLTGQLGKTASAARNLAVGEQTIDKLKTDFKGLSNAPKEVGSQLKDLSTKLQEIQTIEANEGRTVNWATKYTEWKSELDAVTAKIRVLQKEQSKLTSNQVLTTADLKKADRAYLTKVNSGVSNNSKEVAKMAKAHGWTDWDITGIEKADGMVKKLTVTFTDAEGAMKRFVMQRDKIDTGNRVYNGLVQVGDVEVIKSANKALKEEIADREKLAQLMADGREKAEQERIAKENANKVSIQEQSDKILQKVDVGDYDTIIKKQIKDLQKYGYAAEQAESQVFGLTNALKIMSSVDSTPEERIIAEQKFQTLLSETTNVVAGAKSEWQGLVTVQQRLTKANAIEAFLQKNTRITAEARMTLEGYISSLRDVDKEMSKVAKNNIDVKFKEIENSMRGMNKLGYALSDQLKQAASSFAQWISVSNMIMTGIYRTREAVNELIDVDNILTEISKTSDMTKNELIELSNASFESASKLGRTAPDYLNTVMDMSRSGFYGDQAEAMAEQVLLAQTAGDLSQELASNYIIATNAAYKFAGNATKINEVLGGMNIITNRNSVAMKDMAEAMSVAGTVASSYRVNPDEFAAIIGTIESVTKLGGNEVGNAAKALFINLQNITSSKIVGTLERAGASMTEVVDGATKLRTPVEILRDLSETFNTLDEDDPLRAEILTNIGQKYHAAKLSALLENFDMYDKMLQDYSEGFGSAEKEAEKSANNVQGSLNKLSNNWTNIINNMLSSDTMLFGINTLNELLTLINGTTDALGDFGSIGMLSTAIASAKGYGLNHSLQPLFIRLRIMPCN